VYKIEYNGGPEWVQVGVKHLAGGFVMMVARLTGGVGLLLVY